MKKIVFLSLLLSISTINTAQAHCQMPCGIYHDDMVFDMIDQYIETMVKCITVLNDNKAETVVDRNTCIRWVVEKENRTNEIAELITFYFLQQKIKPGEPNTAEMVVAAHKLLFMLVQIKQQVNLDIIKEFFSEWEKFKLYFHIEGYECLMERKSLQKIEEKKAAAAQEKNATPSLPLSK